jgi:hypothetical protein
MVKDVPTRLESLLKRYDQIDVNEDYRRDVFIVLRHSIALAEALISPRFNARETSMDAAHLIATVGKIVHHLQSRPSITGYVIQFPETQTIHMQLFSTPEEARRVATPVFANLKWDIVPVTVQTEIAERPTAIPEPTTLSEATERMSVPAAPEHEME